jgi:hypothetical protein
MQSWRMDSMQNWELKNMQQNCIMDSIQNLQNRADLPSLVWSFYIVSWWTVVLFHDEPLGLFTHRIKMVFLLLSVHASLVIVHTVFFQMILYSPTAFVVSSIFVFFTLWWRKQDFVKFITLCHIKGYGIILDEGSYF